MDHLAEIDDWAVRNAVDMVQFEYEFMILNLLGEDRDVVLRYLELSRQKMRDRIKNLGGEFISYEVEAKTKRIALAILERTFDRLIGAYEHPDERGETIGPD
jgi:hypothetical protein